MSDDNKDAPDPVAAAEAIVNAAIAEGDAERDEAHADDALSEAERKAAEHLADLQRLQAEYVNYRKRVDRDRAAAGELATARAIETLVPVLDDISAAREHGDLTDGPFASIAEKLETALGRLGWSSFGAPGEFFDPTVHEALLSQPSADVTQPTVQHVAQPGHRVGERVLRPARVIVQLPQDEA